MHISPDGVQREHMRGSISPEPAPLAPHEKDYALMRYLAAEEAARRKPANDNHRVSRVVRSGARYTGFNSTSFRYVNVSLPRVAFIDGGAA